MAMMAERERLEKERHLHELNLQQRQLAYLLDRCNSYATQATLVTGFAFTSFSAEALKDLDYINAPVRSFLFVLSGAITMALSIGAVGVSSYLTGKAERLAMEVDVFTAVALVRYRMGWVVWPYQISLLFLWACAALLVFATCKGKELTPDPLDEQLCNLNGIFVILIFVFLGGFVSIYPRYLVHKDVTPAARLAHHESVSSPMAYAPSGSVPSDRDAPQPRALRNPMAGVPLREFTTPNMEMIGGGQGSED